MKFFFIAIFLIFVGCGYKPISEITTKILDDNIWVDVKVSKSDPQNSVAIKDAIREGIKNRLGKNFAPKNLANTKIIASIKSLNFSPMIYDAYGYVTTYKAELELNYEVTFKNGNTKTITTSGESNFKAARLFKNIRNTDSATNEKDRFEAILNASNQAFDEFISRLAIESLK